MPDLDVVMKERKTIIMTVRIPRSLEQQYTELAMMTGISRNELVRIAMIYGLQNMDIPDRRK